MSDRLRDFPTLKTMTLAERFAYLRQAGRYNDVDNNLGQRRLKKWKSQNPFTDEEIFADRLALAGLNEEKMTCCLGLTRLDLSDATTPTWQEKLEVILTSYNENKEFICLSQTSIPNSQFVEALQPFLQHALFGLRKGITALREGYEAVPFTTDVVEELFLANMPSAMAKTWNRVLILELNVARVLGQLQGETTEERFEFFLRSIRSPTKLCALLQEYPVLARILPTLIEQWLAVNLEFLEHLCKDWASLQTVFGETNDLGSLTEFTFGAGDKHRHGRSVVTVKFSSGKQLVYKPRSLAVDIHFQELLCWLNRNGNPWPFKTLQILDCQTHGWVEYISSQPCQTSAEVHRFYKRQGAYLALLYAIEANDFHFENLIAHGENPMLIDLETLFVPQAPHEANEYESGHAILSNSVLQIGLLPMRLWTARVAQGVDVSGLGMQSGQLSPYPSSILRKAQTDEMHIDREHLPFSLAHSQPALLDEPVNLVKYNNDIIEGFESTYNLILHHRKALLAVDGPLHRFAEDCIRFLLRDTQVYALLLQESMHPDLLRDAIDRDRFFDRLWVNTKLAKYFYPVISFECEDLWQFDVPIFTTRPDSKDLWTSHGHRIENFFDKTGMDLVQQKLQQLGPADLKEQIWIIKASLTTVEQLGHRLQPRNANIITSINLQHPQLNLQPDDNHILLFKDAAKIGDHLANSANIQGDKAFWLGIRHDFAGNFYAVEPLGIDLYSGLPGVALFLAYLGYLTHEAKYTDLARQAINSTLSLIRRENTIVNRVGAFEGWGGIIYTLAHLGTLWSDAALIDEAVDKARQLPNLIATDEVFDIIAGSAGCIGALLALNQIIAKSDLLEIAADCGDNLIEKAVCIDGDMAWHQRGFVTITRPLAGFSHGVAGIAWSLIHLSQETGNAKYFNVAAKSLNYERCLFSKEAQNWPDLRVVPSTDAQLAGNANNFTSAWCHGAPGIGLARLSTLPWLDDPIVRHEIDVALKTTLAQGFGGGHCLCHGDLGNLELFLQAQQHLSQEWSGHVAAIAANISRSIKDNSWVCGNPSQIEEPGLMTGLAGIGYGLLRAAAPEQVPSVLLLEPPILT